MSKLNKDIILNKITLLFLFLLPLCGLSFLHNRVTTLVVVLFVCIIFLMTLIIKQDSRKNIKYLILYFILVLGYLGINFIRSSNFISLIPNEYSLFNEILTIIKLVMPVIFLYSLYYQNLTKKQYFFIIKSWIILIAGSIVLTNLFKVGLSSYGNEVIKYNIFEWRKGIYYIDTASKGLFTYANQVAVVLLMLLVVIIPKVLDKKNNILYLLLISLAMIMLGTRVSSFGGLLSLVCLFILYLLYIFIKKNKLNKNIFLLLIPMVVWIGLLPISPFQNRNVELRNEPENSVALENENSNKIEEEEDQNSDMLNQKIDYVYDNYNPYYLPNVFFEDYYPIQYDVDFWFNFIKQNPTYKINYRLIENSIIRRMIEVDNKNSNVLFGISNSRIQNVINLERDFLLHYYSFGIVGSVVLLVVYIILLGFNLFSLFKKQTFEDIIFCSMIMLFILSAFLTGNIINSLFPVLCFMFLVNRKVNIKN